MSLLGKVSIVIPVYNVSGYLDRMVQSVLNQSYKNLELILVNDGSTDGSGEICNQYQLKDSRVRVIHQDNQGVSVARNVGMSLSTGTYLLFCDGDDCLKAGALETSVRLIEATNADVVIFGWEVVNPSGNINYKYDESQIITDKQMILQKILEHYSAFGGGYPWNKLWRMKAIGAEVENIPRFDSELTFFEDLEWVIRMLIKTEKIAVCSECLYQYHIRDDSATNQKEYAERKEISYHKALQKVIATIKPYTNLEEWFRSRYYGELIHGVIGANRRKQKHLKMLLYQRVVSEQKQILQSNLSLYLKLRCIYVLWAFKNIPDEV